MQCEAGAAGVSLVFLSVAGRDMRPAAHLLSFASPKESRQRKGDPAVRDPSASLRGNLWCSRMGCAVELTARLRRFVQTTTASQFKKHGRFDAHAHPMRCAPRHGQKGGGTTRAIAALGLVRGAPFVGPSAAMARVGLFTPPVAAPQVCPVAQRRGRRLGGVFFASFLARARKEVARRGESRPANIKKKSYSRNTSKP